MFYDLENPLTFMRDIASCLDRDGIWITEQSYMPTMLEKLSFDTICHEHLEYYTLQQIKWMADKFRPSNYRCIIKFIKWGKFSYYIRSSRWLSRVSNLTNIGYIDAMESSLHLNDPITYSNFMKRCDEIKNTLVSFLHEQKKTGKRISIYGASTKGNTLLQYFGIDHNLVDSVAEKNADKCGKYTPGTLIPILSETEVRNSRPHFMLVLPWHFKDEFILRENEYLMSGGQLIFPLPSLDIISGWKKILVTGITGQIGQYLTNILLNEEKVHIYGLLHNCINVSNQVFCLFGDILSNGKIEEIISLIKPDEIYNLVGESDSRTSFSDPIRAMNLTHGVVVRICEAMRHLQNSVRLFNASSAEIYKGLRKHIISENEQITHPLNPYAIGKLAAYSAIKHYREKYGMNCSSGIIFTTESPLRRSTFLISKVCSKVLEIKNGMNTQLSIGNLDNYRDWIHAEDVANAMIKILHCKKADDYIISMTKLTSVKELIETAFECIGITLIWKKIDGITYGLDSSSPDHIYVTSTSNEETDEMLMGDNAKLRSIGWNPKFSLKTIVEIY